MVQKRKGGEGNREADRRYREAAQKTARQTSGGERKRKARSLNPEEIEEGRSAEEKGRSRARK